MRFLEHARSSNSKGGAPAERCPGGGKAGAGEGGKLRWGESGTGAFRTFQRSFLEKACAEKNFRRNGSGESALEK